MELKTRQPAASFRWRHEILRVGVRRPKKESNRLSYRARASLRNSLRRSMAVRYNQPSVTHCARGCLDHFKDFTASSSARAGHSRDDRATIVLRIENRFEIDFRTARIHFDNGFA
jgi:hypothetical protein